MAKSNIEASIRFSVVPEFVADARQSGLSANAVRLYAILDRYGNSEGAVATPARKTLAKRCGVSPATIDRAREELVAAGLLEVIVRRTDTGAQTSNEYRLHRVPLCTTDEGVITGDEGPLVMGDEQQREPSTETSVSPSGETALEPSFVAWFVDETRRVTGTDPLANAKARIGRDSRTLSGQGVTDVTIRAAITELVEAGLGVGSFLGIADQEHRGGYRGRRRNGLSSTDLAKQALELEAAGR